MTLKFWFTLSGHTLVLVGIKNLSLPYKLFLNNMGKNGMGVESMDVDMV